MLKARSFAALAVFGWIVCFGIPAFGADFVTGMDDVPLMGGLEPLPGKGLSFATARGRLVESYARTGRNAGEVLDFYRQTLPQLGWSPSGNQAFVRDSEQLEIHFTAGPRGLIVRFSLSPRN
ncbi:hypothetical protein IHV25_05505 [Phaeovibrio sulfidiphilus]|uniref:Uncharacterized protein n=1 Tax=Phaeovibrio sulfidiphilus TaxID=1220600 RepID=A0A8J6YIW6_9PROT|nr:hypothetical protein [Phaeovibrio sulfidiphilus]MBE1237101.1 hypothetical protein [Phaeovibrio sulfidiphilus]